MFNSVVGLQAFTARVFTIDGFRAVGWVDHNVSAVR